MTSHFDGSELSADERFQQELADLCEKFALSEDTRIEVVNMLNADDIDGAVGVFEANNVDIDAIITKVSASVLDEALAVAE